MKYFTDADQLTDFAKYKAQLKKVLPKLKSKPERFRYYEEYDFGSGGKRPILVVGELDPALLRTIQKKGKRPGEGRCTRSEAEGLELAVRKGKVDEGKVDKCLKAAKYTARITVRPMADQEQELDDLEESGAVTAGTEAHGAGLEAHLQARHAPGAREEKSQEILEMMERAANAEKAEDAPAAHAVSAHGPGTDQTPRLVTGRRADQVAEEAAEGTTPEASVRLTGNDQLPDTDMPAWDSVGDDASPVSSRFQGATEMLLVIEEALSQATQLQSFVAAEIKAAKDERELLALPEVRSTLEALVASRQQVDRARTELEQARDRRKGVKPKLVALKKLNKTFEEASAAFQAAMETARGERGAPEGTELGDGRFVRTVRPGVTTGESFEVEGAPAYADPEALTPEEMQARFEKIKKTEGLSEATVVMDPAHVTGEDGVKRRAGWQVQTAFPTGGDDAREGFTQDEYALKRAEERLSKAERVRAQANERRTAVNEELTELRKQRKAADTERSGLETLFYEAQAEAREDESAAAQEKLAAAQAAYEAAEATFEERKAAVKAKTGDFDRVTAIRDQAQAAVDAATEEVERARASDQS